MLSTFEPKYSCLLAFDKLLIPCSIPSFSFLWYYSLLPNNIFPKSTEPVYNSFNTVSSYLSLLSKILYTSEPVPSQVGFHHYSHLIYCYVLSMTQQTYSKQLVLILVLSRSRRSPTSLSSPKLQNRASCHEPLSDLL